MVLGNVTKDHTVLIHVGFLSSATVFEGSFHVKIPSSILTLLSESTQPPELSVEIITTSPLTEVFSPKALNTVTQSNDYVKMELNKKLSDDEEMDVYFRVWDGDRPVIAVEENEQGEVGVMVQVMPTFQPEP